MEYKVVPIKGQRMISPIKEQVIEKARAFGWQPHQVEGDLNHPFSEYYCLMHAKELMGFVALHHIFEEAAINLVYIDPAYRQKGLGTSLLQFVEDQLRARGLENIFLEVRKSNFPAQKLYEKNHYQYLTTRKNYYNHPPEDAIIYQKSLGKGVTYDEAD